MLFYIAFSIHGTNTFITASRNFDDAKDLKPEFTVATSRRPNKTNAETKLHWNKLITKTGNPLRSPAMILHHFNQLEKDGWNINKRNFINYHYR